MVDLHMSPCLLCTSSDVALHMYLHGRPYHACSNCGLIFVPKRFHPSRREEHRRYETHNNDPSDEGYRQFLRRVTVPLRRRVPSPAEGLDFGSGPGPTLSMMLEEHGYEMAIYDPFFAPGKSVLDRTYVFITCTETAEHFHAPADEFDRLFKLLRPGGWLAVMTQWADGRNFKHWSYARDATHVCFFKFETMVWIAEQFRCDLETPRRDVAFFRKSPSILE